MPSMTNDSLNQIIIEAKDDLIFKENGKMGPLESAIYNRGVKDMADSLMKVFRKRGMK